MLLSIDRVLQLLANGKSVDKIAELAECSPNDVVSVIEEARSVLQKHDKSFSKKKIIIKKSHDHSKEAGDSHLEEVLEGAELSAVPIDSTLTIYTDGASKGNPGPAGIGLVIFDNEDRQVGKVSAYIGRKTNNFAEYTAIIRALEIAQYFNARVLKIRTDSELVVKQVKGEYKVKNENIRPLYSAVMKLKSHFKNCKIEHVTRNFNEKADYLANKAVLSRKTLNER